MGTTVLDAFVVTLGLDTSKFGAGVSDSQKKLDKFDARVKSLGINERSLDDTQKKALKSLRDLAAQSNRTGKELQSTTSVASDLWKVMEKGAVTFGAALGVSELAKFTEQSYQINGAMTRLGPNMGLAAKEADAWGKAVEKAVGGNRGAALGVMQNFSNSLNNIQINGPGPLAAMVAFASRYSGGKPIPFIGPGGKPRSVESFFLDLADPLKAMGPAKAQAYGANFGLDPDTINFLDRGRGAVEKDLADARKNTLSDDEYKADEEARKAANDAAQAFNNLKDSIVAFSAPAVTTALKNMTAWFHWLKDHDDAKFATAVRANDAAAHDTKDDPGGKKWLAARDAETALPLVKDPGQSWGKGGGAAFWTDDQKKARLAQLLADGETVDSAAAIVSAEMAAGRAPGAQAPVAPLGAGPAGAGAAVGDDLLDRVRKVESGSNPNQTSPAGAQGPYQLMPATSRALGVTDPFNEGQARAGARTLLSQLLVRYRGDKRKALAAYNWNPAGLDADIAAHGDNWAQYLPRETAAYLPRFADLTGGGAATGGGSSGSGDTTIHQNGQVVINVPSGDPQHIASAWHKTVVDQAQSGPS